MASSIAWKTDARLGAVWLLEKVCRYDSDAEAAELVETLRRFTPLERSHLALLDEFGRLREKLLARERLPRDPAAPLAGELVPAGDGPQLGLARMVLGLGRLSSAPAANRLRMIIEEFAGEWQHLQRRLERLRREFAREAERVQLLAFLRGVEQLLLPREAPRLGQVTIVPVWVPRPLNAAAVGSTIILPVAESQLSEPAILADVLAAAVHEYGHLCAATLGHSRRVALTNQILAGGLPNRHHANLVDEALHTAIGNLIFRERAYPQLSAPLVAYGYEGRSEYPYAIDQLARRLQPVVESIFGEGEDAYDDLINEGLSAQAVVIAPRPSHVASVAFVHSDERVALRLFTSTFPGLQRWTVATASELDRLVSANPTLPSWSLKIGPIGAGNARGKIADRAAKPTTALAGVRAIAWAASPIVSHVPAVRFQLRARTLSAMRDLLCALHQADRLPNLERPLVVAAEARPTQAVRTAAE